MHSRFHQADLLTAASAPSQIPADSGREVAFAGRSNVGKSSALNTILQRKKLARTSSTPGRTQQIFFYALGQADRRVVDLPGYGYAKAPASVKAQWAELIEGYLMDRASLAGLVLITDVRRPLGDMDRQLLDWADYFELPLHILLTKADRAKKNEARQNRHWVTSDLASRFPEVDVTLFSATKGTGVDAARHWLAIRLGLDEQGET